MHKHTENRVLSLLRKNCKEAWIGKTWKISLFQETQSVDVPILVNYPNEFSLGYAVAITSQTYAISQEGNFYFFTPVQDGVKFILRTHMQVKVVDFDLIDYNEKTGHMVRDGNPISQSQGEDYEKKICRLLPITDENNWKERQLALFSYINSGWTILKDRNAVTFRNMEGGDELDPNTVWITTSFVPVSEALKTK